MFREETRKKRLEKERAAGIYPICRCRKISR
jgi:hypothetical protein